jgi:hypothetical protein
VDEGVVVGSENVSNGEDGLTLSDLRTKESLLEGNLVFLGGVLVLSSLLGGFLLGSGSALILPGLSIPDCSISIRSGTFLSRIFKTKDCSLIPDTPNN